MTPRAELFGRIEDYCLELLDAQERLEFEKELEINEELREEVELHKNIQAAITELDVLDLKDKLESIQIKNEAEESTNGSFELLDELTQIHEVTEQLTADELINNFESLPKVHVYQHEITSNENIHPYYKEQHIGEAINGFEELIDEAEFTELEGLEEAILEADILNLRETLQQVSKSVEPQYSLEEIDEFINDELGEDILAEFEAELEVNDALMDEVILHKEIESAVEETDIMGLREGLRNIMETETSWNVSEKSIEDFIDGMLEEDLLEEFGAELKENTDLMAELALREHVNEAIGESDIQSLRAKLSDAKGEAEKKEVKSIVMPHFEVGTTRFWRNSVAMIIILVGLAGVLNMGLNSHNNTFDKFYSPPEWTAERSVSSSVGLIQSAQIHFQANELHKALNVLNQEGIPKEEAFVPQFYKALIYQNMNNYENAIEEYTKVILHGKNLFVEEAEWYKALCYLKLNQKAEAKKELLAVIERRGHYENDAKAIIRRLKYSFN